MEKSISTIRTNVKGFNPYFIGLPILILPTLVESILCLLFQSLFYWITYSYIMEDWRTTPDSFSFNPYFIGLPILIRWIFSIYSFLIQSFNPYFIGLPILMVKLNVLNILEDILFQSLFYWITYSYYHTIIL